MNALIPFLILGIVITLLNYLLIVRPLRERLDVLTEVLKLFAAQREAALNGQKRPVMKQIYEDWTRHHRIGDLFGTDEAGVLSAEIPGPKAKGW